MKTLAATIMFAVIVVLLSGTGQTEQAFATAQGTIDLFSGKPCSLCHPSKTAGPGVHSALKGNRCTPCHKLSNGNHQIDHRLSEAKDRTARLCYECHIDQSRLKSVHPPIIDNDCLGCHTPHASSHGNLLKLPLVRLCFNCHEKGLVKNRTLMTTGFRDGNLNLHYLHAKKKKVSCLSCHEVHAGSQDHLIRTVGWSGKNRVTMTYQATTQGGSCTSSCHDETDYERK